MVNEDIVTSLNNAVVRGESLQTAVQILINSGYNSSQVYEASKFVQGGVITNLESKPEELLIKNTNQVDKSNNLQKTNDSQKINNFQKLDTNKNNQNTALNQEQTQTENKSYKKEIILVIILLFLIGLLALTIFFRDDILLYLSG
ncbi:MAG: hypothetical protein AABW83_04330 [Nanoarchaeota archaeon]